MYKRDKVTKEPFKILLRYMEGLAGVARERTKEMANEIIEREGDFTEAEDALIREEEAAATAANTAQNAASTETGTYQTSDDSSLRPSDPKEAERLKAFRLLRAKKVVLALTEKSSDEEDSDEDGDEGD
mmetsp:Transcript_45833/g.103527  ORF Transcript_45833/g.103527 Transcript_45833/m.103527 type:complete len:129 (-) Transcript_45833:141-527(-)